MSRRKLNEEELKLSTKNLEIIEKDIEYRKEILELLNYQLKTYEDGFNGEFLRKYKMELIKRKIEMKTILKQIKEKDYDLKLEESKLNTLKDQIENGVEEKQTKEDKK